MKEKIEKSRDSLFKRKKLFGLVFTDEALTVKVIDSVKRLCMKVMS
jgi:hypothetical protein